MKSIDIIAKNVLYSNSGKAYEYAIRFEINPATGEIRFNEETGVLPVRPYILLHLLTEVLIAVNPLLLEGEEVATYVTNPCRQSGRTHPALEVSGKRYRLSQEVKGSWINNPDVLPMIRYILNLKELDPIAYDSAYVWGTGGYYLLNPESTEKWKYWAQG